MKTLPKIFFLTLFIAFTFCNTHVFAEDGPKLININTATVEELQTLPAIGPVTATKIITYRLEHPFKAKEEIMLVSGIGDSKYSKIKDLIIVK